MDDARLHRMADKQEIEEVLLRWCRGLDRGDEELLRSTYHSDAVDEHGEVTYTGETAARLYIEKHKRAFKRHMHLTLNVLVELDGDRATAESYQMALLVPNEGGQESLMVAAGRYLDRLERRDGEWRFVHRHWIKETILKLDQVPNALWRSYIDAERGEQAAHGLPYSGTRSKDDLSYTYLRSTSSAP